MNHSNGITSLYLYEVVSDGEVESYLTPKMALSQARKGKNWRIERTSWKVFHADEVAMCGDDPLIIAQSKTDTPGTMQRLYREGKLGSAPPLASYLADMATGDTCRAWWNAVSII